MDIKSTADNVYYVLGQIPFLTDDGRVKPTFVVRPPKYFVCTSCKKRKRITSLAFTDIFRHRICKKCYIKCGG